MTTYDPVRTVIKEQIRNARFFARELKDSLERLEDRAPIPLSPAGLIAGISDKALSRVERLATNLVSRDPFRFGDEVAPTTFRSFTSEPSDAYKYAFCRGQYSAAKRILRLRGISNPCISERAFAKAYTSVSKQHLAYIEAQDTDLLAESAARLALAVLAARPISAPARLTIRKAEDPLDSNLFIAATLALAMLVVSMNDDLDADSSIYDAAAIAVHIRYREVEEAISQADPLSALAAVFDDIAPHLP